MRELTALGIKPNAITYGQYTRAIAEGGSVHLSISLVHLSDQDGVL